MLMVSMDHLAAMAEISNDFNIALRLICCVVCCDSFSFASVKIYTTTIIIMILECNLRVNTVVNSHDLENIHSHIFAIQRYNNNNNCNGKL